MSLPLIADAALIAAVIAGPLAFQALSARHRSRNTPPAAHRPADDDMRPSLSLVPPLPPAGLDESLSDHPAARGRAVREAEQEWSRIWEVIEDAP